MGPFDSSASSMDSALAKLRRDHQYSYCASRSIYYRLVAVWIHDGRLAALSPGQRCMRQPFFDDQPESEPVSHLRQQIRNNDRFASAGHSKQDAVLARPNPTRSKTG